MNDLQRAASDNTRDEEWLVRMFRTLDDENKHGMLVAFCSNIVLCNLTKGSSSFFPSDEDDGLDRHEQVEEFLSLCEPSRPELADFYVDWIYEVLEPAYQDGLAFGLLGDEETALSYAENLVDSWLRAFRDQVHGNEDDFTEKQAVEYIRDWRAQIIRKLEENSDS